MVTDVTAAVFVAALNDPAVTVPVPPPPDAGGVVTVAAFDAADLLPAASTARTV
jgi:hypothetical protein